MHWRLAGQFERRTIKKTYLAIIHGNPPLDSDLIDAPLAVHPKVREKYAVRPDVGKPGVTVYTVKERFDGFALVELAPRTSGTINCGCTWAHIGYPIVGDAMYGGRAVTLADIAPKAVKAAAKGTTEPLMPRYASCPSTTIRPSALFSPCDARSTAASGHDGTIGRAVA